ncbi:MAG: ABC transporter permease [Armatimonadota bacterium]|nr:ABC transporter permease [Armatimonadota bacterium]MDR7533786.1 ABC transporter permease [Armatimonadota bacterium]MDR7535776.1 ABC transporter permease [Armatimonadota bacterium]
MGRRLARDRVTLTALVLIAGIAAAAALAPLLAPYDPHAVDPPRRLEPPSRAHWLGTDELGRDVFSRLLYGARISMTVGLVATGIGLMSGVLVGVCAGYFRRADNLLMRLVEILMAIPSILLALAIVTALGPGLYNVMIAVGVGALPAFARLTRAAVLGLREMEFVQAARAIGATDLHIVGRHILRNALPPVLVYASLHMAGSILAASILSFLGLGVQPPTAEWGAMVSGARAYLREAPFLSTIPSLAIFVVVMSFNLLGDGLRDLLDPRLRGTLGT